MRQVYITGYVPELLVKEHLYSNTLLKTAEQFCTCRFYHSLRMLRGNLSRPLFLAAVRYRSSNFVCLENSFHGYGLILSRSLDDDDGKDLAGVIPVIGVKLM